MQNRKMWGGADKNIFRRASELRGQLTPAEELLWMYLKTKPLGFKFRRQHPYALYIFDFYCHALKLVIEVDGSIHNRQGVKENDQARQALIEKDGLQVIRFTNEEVMNHQEYVLEKLQEIIQTRKNISR